MPQDHLVAQLRHLLDRIWNLGDPEAIRELFAPQVRLYIPQIGRPDTLDGYEEHVAKMRAMFPDLHLEVHELIADERRFVVRYGLTGTYTGQPAMPGRLAANRKMDIMGVDLYRWRDGQVREGWLCRDWLGLHQQLGLIDIPPSPLGGCHAPSPLAAAQPSAIIAPPHAPRPGEGSRHNAEFRHLLHLIWNERAPGALEELFHQDVVLHLPSGGLATGLPALRAHIDAVLSPIPGLRVDVLEIVQLQQRLVVRCAWSGAYAGGVAQVDGAAVGQRVVIECLTYYHLEEGKVAEGWLCYDLMGLYQQLGALPPRPG